MDVAVKSRLRHAARALRSRNYRLFFFGQGVSLIGTWITRVASSWLVYRLTKSAFLLGLVAFVGQIPAGLLMPLGGVIVDRANRRRILIAAQIVAMTASLGLAYFALRGTIDIAHIIVLNLLAGVSTAFDVPARQSFVVEMVEDRADLGSAIALNSTIFHGARLIGPTIAGALVAAYGEGWCFLIDGVSFLAVIAALAAMRVPSKPPRQATTRIGHELREGMTATFGSAPIRSIMVLLASMSLLGASYSVLLPIFAARILHGDSLTFGFLTAAPGIGALCGGIYLAMRSTVVGLGRVIAACGGVFGIATIGFGLSARLELSLPLLAVMGFTMMVQAAGGNTIVQTIVDDDKRGRVMSLFALAFMGMMPIGNLIAGAVSDRIGAPRTLVICGSLCILASMWFARILPQLRPLVRSIYQARGILPAIPTTTPTLVETVE